MIYKELERKNGHTIIVKNAIEGYKLNILAIDGKSEQNGEPTPDNPIEIVNVGKHDEASGKYAVEVKCTGKNLLKIATTITTINGVECKISENGEVVVNGTATADCNFLLCTTPILTAKKKYILNGCPTNGSISTYYLQYSNYKDKTYNDVGDGIEFEAFDLETYPNTRVRLCVKNGTTFSNLVFKPMIRLAEITDDTYEPYKETTTTVYLDEPLRKGDVICQKDGVWGVERCGDVIILNGTETYNNNESWSNKNAFMLSDYLWTPKPVIGYETVADIICDSLIVTTPTLIANGESNAIGQGGSVENGGKTIYVDIDGINTATDLKAYLAENPITVEYTLAEPIFTPFAEQTVFDGLSMFYPTTIISNDCNANMEVEYSLYEYRTWDSQDRFNINDYNRIKQNLSWIHKRATRLYKSFDIADMGEDIVSYESYWNAEYFNAFEENVDIINNAIFTKDYGIAQRFYENGPFIKWDELNRIENACLRMKQILDGQELSLRKLSFRLGSMKGVNV